MSTVRRIIVIEVSDEDPTKLTDIQFDEKMMEFFMAAAKIRNILSRDWSWEKKFDYVFKVEIPLDTYQLEWYDPDTTYEEDVRAFANAVFEKADELEEIAHPFESMVWVRAKETWDVYI